MTVTTGGRQDRRRDTELRNAVDRVRTKGAEKNSEVLYQRTLGEVCEMSSSPLGFVVEQSTGVDGLGQTLLIRATSGDGKPFQLQANTPAPLCFHSVIEPIFQSCKTQCFSRSQLDILGVHDEALKQLISIPVVDREDCIAVMVLLNSPAPYEVELAKRIWPLLVTTVCIRRMNFNNDDVDSVESIINSQTQLAGAYSSLRRHAPFGMVLLNVNHKIIQLNPAAERIFGLHSDDVQNYDISQLIPEQYANQHHIHSFGVHHLANNGGKPATFNGRRSDGSELPISVSVIAYREHGHTHFLLTIEDLSEVERIKSEQSAQAQRFKAVADLAPIGILQTDRNWEACYANDRWCDISGLSSEEVTGLGWINGIYHEDINQTLESLRNSIMAGQEFTNECRFQTPLGDIVWVELHARPMFDRDGDIDGFVATLIDCTYRHITEDKLRVMAEQDTLTGLANRALFQDRLEHGLERVDRHGALALLCLDLDGFKNVNDTLGHDCGDELLIEVAKRLRKCVRNEDTVARVGGDEFMVLMEDLKNAGIAADVSEKILRQLEVPYLISGQEVFISTSIGISFCVGPQSADAKSLLKQGDIALYRAKNEGRNTYQFYSPELEGISKERLYLGNCLHRALERSEFDVYYQLQANTATGEIVGTEALLRWQHPERGLLGPATFITLLEETGLITPVSRWLWFQAFKDHKNWIEQGLIKHSATVSINLSPRQLREAQLVSSLECAIRDAGLEASSVTVEITETVLLEDSSHTADVIKSLKAIGVKIALDDFGTGYSSLTYLKRYPIDIIKIDQTFIRDLLDDPEDAAITQALLVLAKSLKLRTVSEGVENETTLKRLTDWGCDVYQGYYLNMPCGSHGVERLLKEKLSHKVVSIAPPNMKQ